MDMLRQLHWQSKLDPMPLKSIQPTKVFFLNFWDLAQRIEKELNEKEFGLWAVELPNIASFIGFIGLHCPDFTAHFTPCIEIGWRLDRNYWGHGYALEGAQEVLKYGFADLKLKEIVAFAPQIHKRSIRVMQKLNMKSDPNENFIHPKISKESHLNPFVLYRITKTEYDVSDIKGIGQ